MKEYILVTMLVIITPLSNADEIGGFFIGTDVLSNVKYDHTPAGRYELDPVGFGFGFYIPINLPVLDYGYKVKTSFHGISERNWEWGERHNYPQTFLYDQHLSVLNEVLIGKEMLLPRNFGILPQGGIGVLIEALFDNNGTGIKSVVNHCLFLDINCAFRLHFKNIGIALSTSYLHSVRPSWEGYTATDRLSTSIGIFK